MIRLYTNDNDYDEYRLQSDEYYYMKIDSDKHSWFLVCDPYDAALKITQKKLLGRLPYNIELGGTGL